MRVERGGPRVAERGVVVTHPRDDLEEQEDREGPRPRPHPARPRWKREIFRVSLAGYLWCMLLTDTNRNGSRTRHRLALK